MNIVNLTPHRIVLFLGGEKIIYSSSKKRAICRVRSKQVKLKTINKIPLRHITYLDTELLPEPKQDTYYLVSLVVAQNNKDRKDLICPDTSPSSVVRDEDGRMLGVTGFACYWNQEE